jgi:hypothetical protein
MIKKRGLMKTHKGRSLLVALAAVLSVASVQTLSAQTFYSVPVYGGASLAQVSAGGKSVWGIDTSEVPYIYQGGEFVPASNIALTQIAVGGGTTFQADEVWALDSLDRIYFASPGEMAWNFNYVPGALSQIAVGPGYNDRCHPYEVWGVNASSQIYRFNYCTRQFEQVPGWLKQLSVGGGDIWGVNKSNQIFRFNFKTLTFKQLPGLLTQITVGVDGVWGINASQQIYQFDPSKQLFVGLPGYLAQITAGGNGVWGLNSSSQIFRFDPGTQLFVQIPGLLATISVGTGGGVWGINASEQVYAFSRP